MKVCFLFFLMLHLFYTNAQNVGINKPNPQEALDINGNIQLNGALKINGEAGQPGQALVSTGTGLSWVDAAANDFKQFRSYIGPLTNFNWSKPANVTRVMVEAWGGGGGGGSEGAGGGGAYAMAILDVTNVTQLTFTIGAGGTGGGNLGSPTGGTGTAGGTTSVSWIDNAVNRSFNAPGANPGTNIGSGTGGGVNPASFVSNVPESTSLLQLPGQPGRPAFRTYVQTATTTFNVVTEGGRGGGTYRFENNGGIGHNFINNGGSPLIISYGRGGTAPGGGGGTGYTIGNGADNNGGAGMVIIRW